MKKQLLYSNPKYYSLLKKYNKLYLRLKDMLTSGLYHTLAQRTQKTLYNKFKKLYSRLNKLNLSLGLKLSGVVVAFTLISNAVSAQTTPKIWIERPEGTNVFTQTLNPKGQSLAKFVDIDGDGDDDLFLGGRNTNYNYKFYRNQGVNSDTLFVFEDNSVDSLSVLPISTTSNIPPYFDFYDNDGDGDLDIYATNPDTASGLVVYYKNVGTTTNPDFVLTTGTENKFASIDSVYSIAFVNFDDDSDQDVVFMGSVVHSADYYKNDGGTFTRQIGTNDPFSALGLRGTAIDFLDLNNDNLLDAIANDHFNLLTLEQVRNGDTINFVSTTDAINISNAWKMHLSFTDLDEDGDKDLVYSSHYLSTDNFKYFRHDADTFIEAPLPVGVPSSIILDVEEIPNFIDIDNDGDLDLYVDNKDDAYDFDRFYKNIGDSVSPKFQKTPFEQLNITGLKPSSTEAFVDIDNDSDLDMFTIAYYSSAIFYKNIGTASSPNFQEQAQSNNPFSTVYSRSKFNKSTFSDIDNDGDFDAILYIQGESSGVVRIFKNVGTVDTATYNIESFTADAFLLYENITNLDFVDLDDDGKKDLILGKYNDDDLSDGADAFRIYRNTSTQNEIGFTRLTGSENILDTMYAGLGNFAFVNLFGESEKSILINERDGENYDRFRYYTLYDLFSAFEGSTYTIAEDAIVGDVVGAINYTYRGSGTISKTITAGNTGNAFSISGNNIVVQTPDVIDYDIETNRTFNLTIEISDGTHSVNATYVINVSDVQTNVETLENDFRIYPNPIVDKLNIDIGDSFGNKVRLSLINNLGVVVYKQEALANTTATIYTSELEAGFYFVEIKSDTKTIIQKIIIK